MDENHRRSPDVPRLRAKQEPMTSSVTSGGFGAASHVRRISLPLMRANFRHVAGACGLPGSGRLKLQGAGMTDGDRARIFWPARSELSKHGLHLIDKKIDNVAGALRAQRTKAPQKSFARKHNVRPERYGARDIEPGADAAVQHDDRPSANGAADGRKDVNGCGQAFDLTAAVIRDDDAVHAKRDAFLGIGRVQDPFDYKWTLPALAIAGDLCPGECPTHLAAHQACDFFCS